MTEKAIDWVDLAAKAGTELKGLIREAHQEARDLKTEIQLARKLGAHLHKVCTELDAMIERALDDMKEQGIAEFAAHREVMAEIGAEIGTEIGFDLLLRVRTVLEAQLDKWQAMYDAVGVNRTMPAFGRAELDGIVQEIDRHT